MKKGIIMGVFVFLLLFLSMLLVSAAPKKNSDEFNCLKQCIDEKKNDTSYCTLNSRWELYDCKFKNRLCIFNMDSIGGKIITNVQNCRTNYSKCNKDQAKKKKDCTTKTNSEYNLCKKACKQILNCTNEYSPVCGVDGITYTNECFLRKAGVNKDYSGICIKSCVNNNDCLTDEYCKYPDGSCTWNIDYLEQGSVNCLDPSLNALDKSLNNCVPIGKCIKTNSTCSSSNSQVCGCDGKTYANDCKLEEARQSKAYNGACNELTCNELMQKISLEMTKAQRCDNTTQCIIGFLGNPCSLFTCGSGFNIFADTIELRRLSDLYTETCRPICPQYLCMDPYAGYSKCVNSKCQIFYWDNNNNRLKKY